MTVYVGIDPGLTGAIAAIDTATGMVAITDMPTMELETMAMVKRRIDGLGLARALRALNPADQAVAVYLEHMQASGGGKGKASGPADASLMRTYGSIEAVLDCLRLKPERIMPQVWKRTYGLKGGQKDEALDKARALYPAAQGYLRRKLDHNRAEALLLAHYGRTREA